MMLVSQLDFTETHINSLEANDGVCQSFTYNEIHTEVIGFFLTAIVQPTVLFI